MEIVDTIPRRTRKRKFPRDTTTQATAFPASPSVQPAEELRDNADAKKKVEQAVKEIPEIFTPENVIWVFDAYVAILSFLYSYALKTSFEAIQEELEFSQEQKEGLAKPLAKICSKYAPAEWAGMKDEIQLVTMLGIYTVASFQRARNVAKKEKEKERDKDRTVPVAPMRPQPVREQHVPA